MDNDKVYVVVYERIDVDCPFDTEFRVEGIWKDEREAEECMWEDWGNVTEELDANQEHILHSEKYDDNCEIRVGCVNCGDTASVIFRWRVVMKTIQNTPLKS